MRKPHLSYSRMYGWCFSIRPLDCTPNERRLWEHAYNWCVRMRKWTYHQQLISDHLWMWLKWGGK